MDEDLIIALGTAVILSSIKNPATKAKVERSMFKVYSSLGNAYPQFSDPDYKPPQVPKT